VPRQLISGRRQQQSKDDGTTLNCAGEVEANVSCVQR
jgi:hypothetical protein